VRDDQADLVDVADDPEGQAVAGARDRRVRVPHVVDAHVGERGGGVPPQADGGRYRSQSGIAEPII